MSTYLWTLNCKPCRIFSFWKGLNLLCARSSTKEVKWLNYMCLPICELVIAIPFSILVTQLLVSENVNLLEEFFYFWKGLKSRCTRPFKWCNLFNFGDFFFSRKDTKRVVFYCFIFYFSLHAFSSWGILKESSLFNSF